MVMQNQPCHKFMKQWIDRAKDQIAQVFQKQEKGIKNVWKIIWNLQLHRPLHTAAYN